MGAEGLDVEVTRTPSSTEQMRGLINGRWQIASTAFDNVLAWSEREGPEVVAIARAGSGVNLPVYVRPEIATWDDLRGKALAVDAVDTAFGLVLRRILQEHNLELDRGLHVRASRRNGLPVGVDGEGRDVRGGAQSSLEQARGGGRHEAHGAPRRGGARLSRRGLRRKPSVGRGQPRHRRCVPACAARGDALGERRDRRGRRRRRNWQHQRCPSARSRRSGHSTTFPTNWNRIRRRSPYRWRFGCASG